jgi:hypothetical protein
MRGKVAPFDRELSYLPPKSGPSSAPQVARATDVLPPLTFNGGPIISSPELVALFWGPLTGTQKRQQPAR